MNLEGADFSAGLPNKIWVSDLTCVAFSSHLLASEHRLADLRLLLQSDLALDILEQSISERQAKVTDALVRYSERYVSFRYTERLTEAGIEASVGTRGGFLRSRAGRVGDRALQDRSDPAAGAGALT